jgi:hypothetical protein
VEVSVPPEPIRMLGVVSLTAGRKERQVPVFGHIPIERVKGIEEDEKQPADVSTQSPLYA